MSDHGHLFSLSEAARACDVSAVTMRRRLRDEVFPNAFKEEVNGSETWRIPIGDLLAAGFSPTSDGRPAQLPAPEATVPVAEVIEAVTAAAPAGEILDVDQLAELRADLVAAEHRAELAEARAEERQRSIDILERQVLMLMPGPPVPSETSGPMVLTEPVPTGPLRKKRWWQR